MRVFFFAFECVVWIVNDYVERFIASIFFLIIQANVLSVLLSTISEIVIGGEEPENDIENDLKEKNSSRSFILSHLFFLSACMPMLGGLGFQLKKKND